MQDHDLNLLRVLDAVLDTGSVTAAAERLHLSVPATSHALARLRQAAGDPLLVRAGRRLVPTPRAQALRAPVAHWVALTRTLLATKAAQPLATLPRRFVVRAPDGIPIAFGGPLALALRRDMPCAELHFVGEHDGGSLRDVHRRGRPPGQPSSPRIAAPDAQRPHKIKPRTTKAHGHQEVRPLRQALGLVRRTARRHGRQPVREDRPPTGSGQPPGHQGRFR